MIGRPIALIQIPNQRVFQMKAASRYLGISVDSLRTYSDLGLIRAKSLNGRRVFLLADLDAFIDSLPMFQSKPKLDPAENSVESEKGGQ